MLRFMVRAFVVVALLSLVGQATPAFALNEWTVMCYWVSDEGDKTNLIKSHLEAINGMSKMAGVAGSYEFVIQLDAPKGYKVVDGLAKGGAFRIEPGTGTKWNVAADLGEVNMGSPYALWDFLKWAVEKHPARRYALVIGGHGSGIFSWRGTGSVNSADPGAVSFNPDRFVAYDDTDNDCLTVFEVQAILAAFRDRLTRGRPLDLMVLDSCLPGAVETLYQFRDLVQIIVSSPSTTLIGGMPYVTIARNLQKSAALEAPDFGKIIAEAYLRNVMDIGGQDEVMAVYQTAHVEKLAQSMDKLALAFLQAMKETGKSLSIKDLTTYGGSKRYWDLGRMLNALINGAGDFKGAANAAEIKALAQETHEALVSNRITTWYSGDYSEKKVSGLSVAWPEKAEFDKWQKFYQALDFAKATNWDEFLAVWHSLSRR